MKLLMKFFQFKLSQYYLKKVILLKKLFNNLDKQNNSTHKFFMIKPILFIYHKMFDTIMFGKFVVFNTLL